MKKNCLFCQIINRQIPAEIVFENNNILVIKDIKPKAKIHLLIMPKKHLKNINHIQEQDSQILTDLLLAAKKLAKKFQINESGYRLIINNNQHAGQEIDHLHLHLLGGNQL